MQGCLSPTGGPPSTLVGDAKLAFLLELWAFSALDSRGYRLGWYLQLLLPVTLLLREPLTFVGVATLVSMYRFAFT